MKYDFEYAPGSTYEHIVTLLDRHAERGVVIDLGSGAARIAAPLRELGFDYVGGELDELALQSMAERGIEHREIDLRDLDALPDAIVEAAAGRPVAAIAMLDVIEHLVDPRAVLRALRTALEHVGASTLAMSVPNVAHNDLAAQLLMGRWELTDAGLLDRTHISLFTNERLRRDLASCGFTTIERLDIVAPETEQHVPVDAPALALSTPMSRALRSWRAQVDAFGDTYQFVGLYRLDPEHAADGADGAEPDDEVETARPFASVVVRTQGTRSSLEDTLVSLAAQTDDAFEVLLIVNADADAVVRVRELVDSFAAEFRSRVQVHLCESATRSVPLNLALDLAKGRYLLFLDDDDVALAHWVETFRLGEEFPGRIIRAICYGQDFAHEPGTSDLHYEPVAAPVSFGPSFDFIEHLVVNKTPFCSIALPVDALRSSGIRFDPELDLIEDFDVLIRAAQVCGVIDSGVATSLYRRWRREPGTRSEITQEAWADSLEVVLQKLDDSPLLLPAGSARRVRHLEYEFHRLAGELHAIRIYLAAVESENAGLRHELDALRRSRFWRLTKPARVATRKLHGLRSRAGKHSAS